MAAPLLCWRQYPCHLGCQLGPGDGAREYGRAALPDAASIECAEEGAQKALSGTSMSSLSVDSAIARSAASRGNTWWAKKLAAAILPV